MPKCSCLFWSVDDEATGTLMTNFYKALRGCPCGLGHADRDARGEGKPPQFRTVLLGQGFGL